MLLVFSIIVTIILMYRSVKLISHLFSTFVTNGVTVNAKETYALFGITRAVQKLT